MKLHQRCVWFLFLMLSSMPLCAKSWYIRPDGGTRYSANMQMGQCDGRSDAAYPGSGANRHCAYNDFRFLWDDKSGKVGVGTWVIDGGDTILIRGCRAGNGQANPSNPDCRVGWDSPYGTGENLWCYAVGSYSCTNPPIPPGTAAQHTRILGQNFATCNRGGATDPREYAANLTQLFGGFSLTNTINLQNTQYVDVQCIELTTHNGKCTRGGVPSYPRACRSEQPLDDYAQNGFVLNNATSHVTLQDVSIHGFNGSGLQGPIGGAITMIRVFAGFNASSGWNFDDGHDTPDAKGSSIAATYVTMIGNGCYEEYPLNHSFPAQACYDDVSNGFGDAWSGQDTDLDSFTCDHCVMAYNTKDAFLGPHTNIRQLTITDSQSYGNMGAQWKWNSTPSSTVSFANNLTIGNCSRFSEPIPGAAHSFARSSGLVGAYLSDFCRAGGNTVAINSQQNSHVLFVNNSFVDYVATVILLGCGPSSHNGNKMCGNTTFTFTNNIFLGYRLGGNEAPGLFYVDDPSIKITASHNIAYGNRPGTGESCAGPNDCADPRFVNEPPSHTWTNQTFLDDFDFHPRLDSPVVRHGGAIETMRSDFYGAPRPDPPSIGAVEPRRVR